VFSDKFDQRLVVDF